MGQHDPDYVFYDPYEPHTQAEIREWEEQQRKLREEREEQNRRISKANVSTEYHKQRFHAGGENIFEPLKTYKMKVWRDRETDEVLKQEVIATYNSDKEVPILERIIGKLKFRTK